MTAVTAIAKPPPIVTRNFSHARTSHRGGCGAVCGWSSTAWLVVRLVMVRALTRSPSKRRLPIAASAGRAQPGAGIMIAGMTLLQPSASATASQTNDEQTAANSDLNAERLPSAGSLRGLDWLNFLLADVQTGVGPFLAIYLASYNWDEQRVGIALTIGGIAGIVSQTPAGALVDRLRSKRSLIAAGVIALAIGALLIAFFPSF